MNDYCGCRLCGMETWIGDVRTVMLVNSFGDVYTMTVCRFCVEKGNEETETQK